MNSSLSDRASANQAFLDALEQLGETFGDALADEQMLPPDSDDATLAQSESKQTPAPRPQELKLPPKPRA
ncbi:MAG: hypothetical protein ACFB9N_14890 [Geitlerinemataceae cyanobacterium]